MSRKPQLLIYHCWRVSVGTIVDALELVHVSRPGRRAFDRSHLALIDCRRIVLARIEIHELIDAVKHFGNKLTEVEPWRHPGVTTQPSGDAAREVGDILIVYDGADPCRVLSLFREKVANATAENEDSCGAKFRVHVSGVHLQNQ
jgi:hypothetical protein